MVVEYFEALVADTCSRAWDEIEDTAVNNFWSLVALAAFAGYLLALH